MLAGTWHDCWQRMRISITSCLLRRLKLKTSMDGPGPPIDQAIGGRSPCTRGRSAPTPANLCIRHQFLRIKHRLGCSTDSRPVQSLLLSHRFA
jgi:hypothetical protein